MKWAVGLNAEQQAAISASSHAALIAGPGTGKTRTLLAKTLQLIEDESATAGRIRLVNFTNAGVRDLKRKVRADSAYASISQDQITTFHSLALRSLLSVESRAIPSPLVILDDWEELHFIDRLVNAELSLGDVRKARRLREDYNARWCQATTDVTKWLNNERRSFERFYRVSQEALQFLTRGELTFVWWNHLHATPGARPEELGVTYSHLLVDEYQDLNECEHEILRMLTKVGVTVFAVGDPNQSIYESMRHAHPEFCAAFPTRVAGGTLHILDQSFRCPATVLEAGAALLDHRQGIPDPRKASPGGEVRLLRFVDDNGEVSGLAQLARSQVSNVPRRRVLVAVPTRSVAAAFAKELRVCHGITILFEATLGAAEASSSSRRGRARGEGSTFPTLRR